MSWYGLLSTLVERATVKRTRDTQPPRACPNDGEPLRPDGRNGLHCPFDGWRWPENDTEAIR